ncbi:restriction endonuclease subunit S [Enterococcus faecalis]|uniref:restriction endonuclease subunit S n=2 Tax=Enterococcus faecalis TaxID=1351 RepID=UPI00200BE3E8|nr:restriction endonuclease subunit S [Enterococcus faecalis]UQF33151.1 restriction endonuclease subunit S [Enterococcus faecalis]
MFYLIKLYHYMENLFNYNWELCKVKDFLIESKIKGSNGKIAKKLTVKLWRKGIVAKEEVYEGSLATQYYVRKSGQFMYGKLDFLNQAFGIVPIELDGYESTVDSPSFDFKPLVDSVFFLEYVSLEKFYKYQGNIANGSRKAKRIHVETFFNMPLPTPSYKEQQKIGTLFKQLDDTITLHQRKLEQLKELKKAYLQVIFPVKDERVPKLRFAAFEEGWELRKLGDITKISTGKLDANAMVENGKYDFYTSGIKKYRIDVPAFEGPAITIAGNGATVGYMHLADNKFNAYQRTYVLQEFVVDRSFLFSEIGNKLPKKINQEARTGNIPYIVMDMLTELKLSIPQDEAEQSKIGSFFKQIDKTITLHQNKLEQLKDLKTSYLQNMFI